MMAFVIVKFIGRLLVRMAHKESSLPVALCIHSLKCPVSNSLLPYLCDETAICDTSAMLLRS